MDAFAALADRNRRRMIELLASGERPAGEIGAAFPLSPPAVSQHLKVLRETGLVRVRVEGQRRVYSLEPQGFDAFDTWLSGIRRFWSGRLDDLERELRKPEAPSTEGNEEP
jgi:DNA-binding transcriptional ArsR family regulator